MSTPPKIRLTKNKSTPEGKAFWDHVEKVAEGVAAPLEPSRPHLIREAKLALLRKAAKWSDEDWESAPTHERHAINAVLDLVAAESRILELEKEIAALPKKIEARIIDAKSVQAKWLCDKADGRWNAALDKAAEMLSRMQVIAGQPRATVEKAVVEIRKLKEIAALRGEAVKKEKLEQKET